MNLFLNSALALRKSVLTTLVILTFSLSYLQEARCQEEAYSEDQVHKKAKLDSVICCCHYMAEIPYIRITLIFSDSARKFDISSSYDEVPATRIKGFQTYRFEIEDMEGKELFLDQDIINYTNCFFVLELVSIEGRNYLLLSENFKITDKRIKQFVKKKIFIDLFTIIDPFHVMDVMQVVEYRAGQADTLYIETLVHDTVYQDTLFMEKFVHDTVYFQVAAGDTSYLSNVIHDTIYVNHVIRDTVFIDIMREERVFVQQDFIDTLSTIKNIVFANNGDYDTDLNYILFSKFSHWFEEPYFTLEFKFKDEIEKLRIIEADSKPQDLPEGYSVQYIISPKKKRLLDLIPDNEYVRLHRKIALKMENNKCYILTRKGLILNPQKFTEKDKKTLAIQINY